MDAQPALQAFAPLDGGGGTGFVSSVTITATGTASAATALPGTAANTASATANQALFYKQIQIANQDATHWVYVNIGTAAVAAAAAATSYPVAPGAVIVITINGLYNYVSVISGGTSSPVIFTRGQGL